MRTHIFITLIALVISACASKENIEVTETPASQNETQYSYNENGDAGSVRGTR